MLITKVESIIADMDVFLRQLDNEENNQLKKARKAIVKISECREQLNNLSIKSFKSTHDEILFFKVYKTSLYSRLYYYSEVYNIEAYMPPGSLKSRKEYLKSHFDKIDEHYTGNKELYHYFNTESSHLDEQYFKMIHKQLTIFTPQQLSCQEDVPVSVHDSTFSRIVANKMLVDYLNNALQSLKEKKVQPERDKEDFLPIETQWEWTESETDAVQVISALRPCVNNGNIELKEFAEHLSRVLGIKIKDFSKKKHKLKEKQNPSSFMDKLRINLDNELFRNDKFHGNP